MTTDHPNQGRGQTFWAGVTAIATLIGVFATIFALVNDFADEPEVLPTPIVNNYLSDLATVPEQETPSESKGCSASPEDKKGGWGPARATVAGPAMFDWPSFNSDRTNEVYGDERNFYTVRDSSIEDGSFLNTIKVEEGGEYTLRLLVKNSTHDADYTTATGTRLLVSLPSCTGRSIASNGFVTSTNSYPDLVWGGVNFISDKNFNLSYVEDSAILYNNAHPEGLKIEGMSFLSKQGIFLGHEEMDGEVRGGHKWASYFYFKVKPQFE